jgi:hypothetical protein
VAPGGFVVYHTFMAGGDSRGPDLAAKATATPPCIFHQKFPI